MSNVDEQRGGQQTVPTEESNGVAQQYAPGHRQQTPPPYGYQRPRRSIETKPFFLTSEFVGSVLAIAGIAITAASSDAFGAWRAWILITAITVGYMISRGIAKSGTHSHADDPREHLDLGRGQGK
jgi:hypothetical protein